MAAKAKIYKEKDRCDNVDLIDQLRDAVEHLAEKSMATKTIFRGGHVAGYGVDKAQRNIAADAVTSITKAIKSQGGW